MIVREDFKVVLLGDRSTGKTSLMKRYFINQYNANQFATISASFDSRIFNIDGKEYQMGVWDTSGEERYRSISCLYYRSAAAAIICYDVCQRQTFQQISYWINELQKVEPDCRLYLCGTKRDLLEQYEPNPPLSYVESYAKENAVKFILTSSKTGENVEELFNEILEDYVSEWRNSPRNSNSIKLHSVKKFKKKRSKKCCSSH